MAIQVENKDCTALSDAELAEMADICVEGRHDGLDIGAIGKQAEEWVLVSQAYLDGRLQGFGLYTLERIGGTPALLIGLAGVKRIAKRNTVLNGLMTDMFRRAVLAFPDEDVLVATRMNDASAFEAFSTLQDINPRPGHRASGEERAWGRRLAKRFGERKYADRQFTVTGTTSPALVFDHESLDPDSIDSDVAALFQDLDLDRGDCLVTYGWAMTENLSKLEA
jgi:hypothetical protein